MLLNEAWMDEFRRRYAAPSRPEWHEFLLAYAAVHQGRACWRLRWHAHTYGDGPPGSDHRFNQEHGVAGTGVSEAVVKRLSRQLDTSSRLDETHPEKP